MFYFKILAQLAKISLPMFKKLGQIGTTIIELLVAISVFSIFITIGSQLLAMALSEHQKALEKAELLNQVSYALEYMNRALRMVQKDTLGNCIAKNFNYENPESNNVAVRFLNYESEAKCVEFFRDITSGVIMVKKSTDNTWGNLGEPVALTTSGLLVDNLYFLLNGQGQDDLLQPSVTIVMKIKSRTTVPQEIQIQSTVSQRQLDVQY